MRVIITGASGFIGKNLLLACPQDWEIYAFYHQSKDFPQFLDEQNLTNVHTIKCDLLDKGALAKIAKSIGTAVDLCVYLAAKVDIPASVDNPAADLHSNTIALLNFLEVFKCDKFIFMSSGAVYEGLKGAVYPGSALDPKLPYAIAKLASEQYVKFYTEQRQTIGNYVIVRFYGAYGRYEPGHKLYSKLLQALYFAGKSDYEIYGDGKNLINAMYIDDAIQGLIKIIHSPNLNVTVDFLGVEPMSVEGLVKKVGDILGRPDIRVNKAGICNEYIEFYSNPGDMQQKFGYTPQTKLVDGINAFLQFAIAANISGTMER